MFQTGPLRVMHAYHDQMKKKEFKLLNAEIQEMKAALSGRRSAGLVILIREAAQSKREASLNFKRAQNYKRVA